MQSKTGPYLRTSITIESVMIDVLISLVPPLLAGMIFFGWRALWIVLLSTVTAVVTEAILLRAPLTLQGIFGDGSAAVTGMLVGLILPSTAAWWVPVLGSILAIALVKQTFGGLGYNIFNPALGARAVLLLAFTSQLVKFSAPFDTVTSATPLLSTTQFDWALFWGNVGGSIGETSVIAILLGGLYLLVKGHIDWRVPVGYVGAAFGMALLWGLDPWFTITAGGLLFGAVYMATDMVTSPVTPTGQLIYGIGCGVLTVFIRQYTPFPEGVTFAILTMNALVPLIESLTMPMIFGVGVSRETRFRGTAVSLGVVALTIIVLVLVNNMEPSTTPVLSDGHYLPIADLLETTEYEIVEEQGTRYYVTWDEEDNLQGAAFTAEQGGFNGPIRFLVVLDEELAVKHIEILEHQEDPGLGALITRTEFLDQFIGKKEDSGFSLGTDLDGVTGATISSRSFAAGVRRALENFHAVFFPSEDNGGWADGKYLGSAESFGGKLEVEVTVSGGKITKVDVLAHSDTPGISDGAIKGVPERIVAANTVKVEAVSGATISSGAVMDAVENALQGAMEETAASADVFTLPADDGTYRGVGQGFGGDLVVDVTVSEGRISEIVVVEHGETPFVADPALKKLIPAIIETQVPVDAVSGATMTSKGLMEALENALSGDAELEEAVQAFEITVDDGTYRGVGQGFGGDLVVDVTVSEGRISEIVVVEHGETPFVADPALKKLIPAIIERQGPVDAVSGATMTSKGLEEALRSALNGKEGQ